MDDETRSTDRGRRGWFGAMLGVAAAVVAVPAAAAVNNAAPARAVGMLPEEQGVEPVQYYRRRYWRRRYWRRGYGRRY